MEKKQKPNISPKPMSTIPEIPFKKFLNLAKPYICMSRFPLHCSTQRSDNKCPAALIVLTYTVSSKHIPHATFHMKSSLCARTFLIPTHALAFLHLFLSQCLPVSSFSHISLVLPSAIPRPPTASFGIRPLPTSPIRILPHPSPHPQPSPPPPPRAKARGWTRLRRTTKSSFVATVKRKRRGRVYLGL